MENIGFIGLGKLGLPCAEVFASKNNVFGFDITDRSKEVEKVVWTPTLSDLVEKSLQFFYYSNLGV